MNICTYLSDYYLFPITQAILILFALLCAVLNWHQRRKAGSGGISLTVTRGEGSMNIFYAMYAVLTGIFVSLSLTVDLAKNHRVLFVALDVLLIAYVCLFNPWFRNKLVGWGDRLTKVETR